MLNRPVLLIWALALSAFSPLWSEPAEGPLALQNSMKAVDSSAVSKSINPIAGAYREHAPLALFSLGSIAIGGVFYGISQGTDGSHVSYTAGDRSSLTTAVTVAGVSALLAAGSYFYFVHRSAVVPEAGESSWSANLTGGPDGAGGVSVGARLTLPLPSAAR